MKLETQAKMEAEQNLTGTVSGERNFGLDLVRAAAVMLVLAVHFFLNGGFYEAPMQGVGMAVSAVVRMMCMTCVPLFLLLTGYLCVGRSWSSGYYKKIVPILLTYLVAGGICLCYRGVFGGARLTPGMVLAQYLNFQAAPYGWYVEMYVGLFLLSPFVNGAWRALTPQGQRAMMLTLVGLTALPATANVVGHIFPDWWMGIYPLAYYVVGAWLREHPLRVGGGWLLTGWLGLAAAVALLRFGVAHGAPFGWSTITDWSSLFVLGESICLFSLLRRRTGAGCPSALRRWIKWIARLSFPMYLVSFVSDQILYPPLIAAVPDVAWRTVYLPLVVLAGVICSGVLALGVDKIVGALLRMIPRRAIVEK